MTIDEAYEQWIHEGAKYLISILDLYNTLSRNALDQANERFKDLLKDQPDQTYINKRLFLSYKLREDGNIHEEASVANER